MKLMWNFFIDELEWIGEQGLGVSSSPTFSTVKLTDLSDGFLPYHVDDATGLADSSVKNVGNALQMFSDVDSYPSMLCYIGAARHDDCGIAFDAYSTNGLNWYSSDPGHDTLVGSNFIIYKTLDTLSVYYASGYGQGAEIAWTKAFDLSATTGTAIAYGDFVVGGASGWTVAEPIQVGGIYLNVTGVNPVIELGYGTWVQVAQGQTIVGET